MRRILVLMAAVLVAVPACFSIAISPAQAEVAYPVRPIRILVPYSAGGASDVMARYFAQKLGERLKATVVIENQAAAAGTVAYTSAARAPADGYTLLYATSSLAVNAALRNRSPYDPLRDFSAIAPLVTIQNVLVVPATMPVHSVAELLALARQKPGELNYVSLGPGSTPHLSMELFRAATGIVIQQVSYKLTPQAYTDLIEGRMHLWIASLPSALPFVLSGKLRALAVAGAVRSSSLPEIPTLMEAGVSAQTTFWQGLFAPAGTPPEIIGQLNRVVRAIATDPEVKDWYTKLGAEVGPGTSEQLDRLLREDFEKWSRLAREIGIEIRDSNSMPNWGLPRRRAERGAVKS